MKSFKDKSSISILIGLDISGNYDKCGKAIYYHHYFVLILNIDYCLLKLWWWQTHLQRDQVFKKLLQLNFEEIFPNLKL